MNSAVLSPDYPKWLYKAGGRDMLVRSAADEDAARAIGYSHERVDDTPAPAVTAGGAVAAAQPGTVPTSVMDSMLETQRERFDSAWARKCSELDKTVEQLKTVNDDHNQLKVEHGALAAKHASLVTDHQTLVDEHAALLAKTSDTTAPVGGPLKVPVIVKKA